MTYLSWGAIYEGASDQAYFELLIPRLMEDIVLTRGINNTTIPPAPAIILKRQTVEEVAKAACSAKDAFYLFFVHADQGGRAVAKTLEERSLRYCEAMYEQCQWPPERCITIAPRHETEAWLLGDPDAVTAALGYRGSPASIGLPSDAREAERVSDPKNLLMTAVNQVRGRRKPFDVKQIFAAIAQRQSLPRLREAQSFSAFETDVIEALASLGSIRSPA